jgi:hypothetical protein
MRFVPMKKAERQAALMLSCAVFLVTS